MVPMMPLAMPPGIGSPASIAFIALYAVGVGSVKNCHDSWSYPLNSTSNSMANNGTAVSAAKKQMPHNISLSFTFLCFVEMLIIFMRFLLA